MARTVVLGAGVAGHTAAAFLRKWLGKEHEVIVVSPKPDYNWLPSNIWVGVGRMSADQVVLPLAPIYARHGIDFRQARALSIHPEGNNSDPAPYVTIESTLQERGGQQEDLRYDYLINATGPKLNFAATPGLGPDFYSTSVCTAGHAVEAANTLLENIARMRAGERRRFVVGTGHGTCTCEGAAFEYAVNLEFELRRHGVRNMADVIYLSNEFELGDFGMGGAHIRRNGYVTPTNIFTESLFAERGIEWIIRSHVQKIEPGKIFYETLAGEEKQLNFDMAMLLPPFSGVGLKTYDRNGQDITPQMFAPNGFMRVDADYNPKPYDQWKASDWPRTYKCPSYANIFAAGIAFAPPHAISQPHTSPRGTPIFAAPPRTGMPSATTGKVVAHTIVDMIKGNGKPAHTASMAELGAACVASSGADILHGSAATMTVYPIVPDYDRYPETGRDLAYTMGEIGLAGHWVKLLLHYLFLYKARLRPGWALIPE